MEYMEKHSHSLKVLKILGCGDPAPLSHSVADCSHDARMKPRVSDVKGKEAPGRRTPNFLSNSTC
jgi:hypothetical protein